MSLLKETTLRPRPDAMTGIRPGTWAHDAITRRWPEILERVYKENTLQSAVVDRLRRIGDDIPDAPIRRGKPSIIGTGDHGRAGRKDHSPQYHYTGSTGAGLHYLQGWPDRHVYPCGTG